MKTRRFVGHAAWGISLLTATILLYSACAPAPPAGSAPPARTLGDGVWKTSDGNEIPYTVVGEGVVTVLLVHCWMCEGSFWSEQVPELAQHYRTIAIDLPGHGKASASRTSWSVAAYGEDVAGLIEGLDLSNVVLVGHSMGGPVALRAAALTHGRVLGIVAVDTLHDAEFKFSGERIEGFLKAFEADFAGTCEEFIGQMIPEEGVNAVRTKVRQAGCDPTRSAIGTALLRSFGEMNMPKWFSGAGVPIRAINALAPNPTKIDTNRKYADFDAVTVAGVGHYLHMTRPAVFNPLLLKAIAEIVGGGAPRS